MVKEGEESAVYSCVGNCKSVFHFVKNVSGGDIIMFENVREVLFRQHTSYGRFIYGEHGSQRVMYTEMCEKDTDIKNGSFNILHHVIDCATENGNFTEEPSISPGGTKPIIRVCAFADVDLFGVDQNRLQKKTLVNNTMTLEDKTHQAEENSTDTSIQQVLSSCFCIENNHSCSHGSQNNAPEFVSIDFDDLLKENDLFK